MTVMKILWNFFTTLIFSLFKIMPFWALYRLSDVLYILCYHVCRLRRHTVRKNLRFIFPHYTPKEIQRIEKDSYRNFCDVILETLKGFTLSPEQLAPRYKLTNPELANIFEQAHGEKHSIIAFMSHFNNWEWGTSLQFQLNYKMFCIYKKLHNKILDDILRNKRSAYGITLVNKDQMSRALVKNRSLRGLYVLIADQRPSSDQEQYQVQFFDHHISCFAGPELIARKCNYPVIYCKVERVKRGFYQLTAIPISHHPKNEPPGEISQRCFSLLEAQIKEHPGNWVWMHNRFKKMNTFYEK